MHLGLRVKNITDDIGTSDLLHAFFSTVHTSLETNGEWGSQFPTLLNRLNNGKIPSEFGTLALQEVLQIQNAFENLNTEEIIWDHKDSSKQPPNYLDANADNLADYFTTPSGKNLLDKLRKNIDRMIRKDAEMFLEKIPAPKNNGSIQINFGTKKPLSK